IRDSRTEGLAEIYRKRFVRLKVSVADDPHIKGASYYPGLKGNYQVNGVVITRGRCCSRCGNCSDCDWLNARTGESQRKRGRLRTGITFRNADIVDTNRRPVIIIDEASPAARAHGCVLDIRDIQKERLLRLIDSIAIDEDHNWFLDFSRCETR